MNAGYCAINKITVSVAVAIYINIGASGQLRKLLLRCSRDVGNRHQKNRQIEYIVAAYLDLYKTNMRNI